MQKVLIVAGLVALSSAALARGTLYRTEDCNRATNQLDLNRCAEFNFESADRALNGIYRKLMEQQSDPRSKDRLIKSEHNWIAYRDSECAREVGPREEGGSIWPMDLASCLKDKTDARIRELQESLNCPAGQSACPK